MPEWLRSIVLSPWFVLAAFAVGIVGTLATFLTYVERAEETRPVLGNDIQLCDRPS